MHENRTKVASLAPIVTAYANKGNKLAMEICDEAVSALKSCVQAVYKNLDLQNKEIAIIGSLGNSDGYFKDKLYEQLLDIDSKFQIHPALAEPVVGSAKKALQNARQQM